MPEHSTTDDAGRVLFVSTGPSIARPASGAGARLHHLSRGLAERGWGVTALVPADATASDTPDWLDAVDTYDQWSMPFLTDLNPHFVRAMARVLRRERPDVVHLSHGVCATRVLSELVGGDAAVVYAAQNVEAEHAREFVAPDLPAHKRLLGPRLVPRIERATIRCADAVTTVSERDRDAFVRRYGVAEERIVAVPTGTEVVDVDALEPRDRVRERLGLGSGPVAVFHGSYAHPPNREAVALLRDEIAPALRGRGVDVEFLLVGEGMPDVDDPEIRSVGFAEELYSTLNAADLAVVPIRHGGGTKTKIYDYVSLGLPMVATENAVRGIDLVDGEHGRFVDAVDERFVAAVAGLVGDAGRREAMGEALRSFAAAHTWERSVEPLEGFYRSVM